MPSFSVVIPTYNRPEFTTRAIQSCLAQSKRPLEVIVVDDHSPQPFAWKGDPIVRVVRHEANFGGGRARNTGIDLGTGDFICFLDSDDIWLPDKLAEIERVILKTCDAEKTVFFHDLMRRRRGLDDRLLTNPDFGRSEHVLEYIFLRDGLVQTSSLVVPAGAAKRVRFDDALRAHQDWDFCHRLELAGLRFQRIPNALAVWSLDEGQQRVSSSRKAAQTMAWVDKLQDTVSPETMIAINAKVVVVRIRTTRPLLALGHLWRAWRAGIIGSRQFFRGIIGMPVAMIRSRLQKS